MALKLLPALGRVRDKNRAILDVRVVRDGARTVVTLRGEADASTTAILSDALARVIAARAGDVVIDLAELAFVDSATVRVIATAHDLLAGQGRTLAVRSPSRLATLVLDLFGLTEFIEAA